jgi:EAL domain-containing protein (putative c-di-GMP-specific phosphodiesterase class I)
VLIDIHTADHIEKQGEFYTARVDDFELHSAFQPVISLTHHRIIGYEGLVRPFQHGEGTTPDRLFKTLAANAFASELDRTCRTLHLMNASLANMTAQANGWLFLNVDANTILEDFYTHDEIRRALDPIGFRPEHIVLEILETNIEDPARLGNFVQHYKQMGFRIALDDFGVGESNFERIYTIHPNIVKLDRHMLHNLVSAYNGLNILKRVVSMLREMGSLVLIEGIETEQQAMMVMETDTDLVQGYYFCKPVIGSPPKEQGEAKRQIKKLALLQKSAARKRMDNHERLEKSVRDVFENAIAASAEGEGTIARVLFQHPHLRCFYVLDHQGYQVSHTYVNPGLKRRMATEAHPLQKTEGTSWVRRDYFFEAVLKPGTTFVSRPYLSLPEEILTITLSSTFRDKQGLLRILCLDVDAASLETNHRE